MRLTYTIPYEAFVALQPPFVSEEGPGLGLMLFFQFAGALAGIGFMLMAVRAAHIVGWTPWPSAPLYRGAIEFALGAFAVVGVWYFRRRSAKSMQREHTEFLRDSYSRLHCRSARFVEVTDEGLVFGCDCKKAINPWNRLSAVVESPLGFMIAGGRETQIVPSAAFGSEAQRTEFRQLLSDKLNENKTFNARTIEFECVAEDWRNAAWLRFKAGGWLRAIGVAILACFGAGMILYFGPMVDYDARFDPPFVAGAIAFVALVLLLLWMRRRRPKPYLGPLKVAFAEDAIYVQSRASESRVPWHQVTGLLIDRKCLILVQRFTTVLLIPGRYISPVQGRYIVELLREKLVRGRGVSTGPKEKET
jgi:hypothetical protein